MFFRATLFSSFGGAKRWLAAQPDGSTRALTAVDYYAAGAITGFTASFAEGPIDLFKSQVQVQIIRSKSIPDYKRARRLHDCGPVPSTLGNRHALLRQRSWEGGDSMALRSRRFREPGSGAGPLGAPAPGPVQGAGL